MGTYGGVCLNSCTGNPHHQSQNKPQTAKHENFHETQQQQSEAAKQSDGPFLFLGILVENDPCQLPHWLAFAQAVASAFATGSWIFIKEGVQWEGGAADGGSII